MADQLKRLLANPKLILVYILGFRIFRNMPDDTYLKLKYWLMMGAKLEIDNPRTFNEKLQWLKMYDRKPQYQDMVDKYKVRDYIAREIGDEYLVPVHGVYNNFDEIKFEDLPNEFVLKPNHTSANVFICKDKSRIDYDVLRSEVDTWLKKNYYWIHREWPYKNIKPKIICEKFLVDESGQELKDYKFMCFNGEPKVIQVMSGRSNNQYYIDHFDQNWNKINLPRKTHKNNPKQIRKPKELKKMISLSEKLSKGIPFSRIDLYETEKGVFFGEITFFPMSGYMDFEFKKDDLTLGGWINIHK